MNMRYDIKFRSFCNFIDIFVEEHMLNWFNGKQEDENCQYDNESGTIMFSDMKPQHMKIVVLGEYDPKRPHRCVGDGLNLEGKCRNQQCTIAFEKMVWVHLGYGVFHINHEVHNVICPICKKQLASETVLTLGYKNAIIKAQGKVMGQEKKKWDPPSQTQGKFIKFEGYDGATSQWQYLTIQAIKP